METVLTHNRQLNKLLDSFYTNYTGSKPLQRTNNPMLNYYTLTRYSSAFAIGVKPAITINYKNYATKRKPLENLQRQLRTCLHWWNGIFNEGDPYDKYNHVDYLITTLNSQSGTCSDCARYSSKATVAGTFLHEYNWDCFAKHARYVYSAELNAHHVDINSGRIHSPLMGWIGSTPDSITIYKDGTKTAAEAVDGFEQLISTVWSPAVQPAIVRESIARGITNRRGTGIPLFCHEFKTAQVDRAKVHIGEIDYLKSLLTNAEQDTYIIDETDNDAFITQLLELVDTKVIASGWMGVPSSGTACNRKTNHQMRRRKAGFFVRGNKITRVKDVLAIESTEWAKELSGTLFDHVGFNRVDQKEDILKVIRSPAAITLYPYAGSSRPLVVRLQECPYCLNISGDYFTQMISQAMSLYMYNDQITYLFTMVLPYSRQKEEEVKPAIQISWDANITPALITTAIGKTLDWLSLVDDTIATTRDIIKSAEPFCSCNPTTCEHHITSTSMDDATNHVVNDEDTVEDIVKQLLSNGKRKRQRSLSPVGEQQRRRGDN